MQILRHLLLISVLMALHGCSFWFGDEGQFRERAMDYQQAKSLPPLEIPETLSSKPLAQRYPIPDVGAANFFVPEDSDSVPKPVSLLNVDEEAGIELREDGSLMWLQVNKPPSVVWPLLQAFVESNSFSVAKEDPKDYVLETDWQIPRQLDSDAGFWRSIARFFAGGDNQSKEKYRFRVTSRPGSSWVFIDYVKTSPPLPSDIVWTSQPDQPEVVTTTYNELMDFVGEMSLRTGSAVLSQDISALPSYTMTWDGNGFPVLVINQDYNHAWLAVGEALVNAQINVSDLNRSLGIYYLEKTVTVQTEGEPDEDRELQLRLVRSESGIQVSVQLDDETLAPKEPSAGILNQLRASLEE